ncbi:voltage-dependent anion-selective channel protein 1 [Sinocyclocheilus rhinocerous]|uniref:voltage-dependent anion-selective channel protein 1 n=1 Tax=Sinocyclocheilus rhinocerous TaxID=307959 RepID=UPI0007BADC84|nr:PREDICTED: voltage-dependent anion-selective channel protein 1 [Sinocyclocheilus rhinocerous]
MAIPPTYVDLGKSARDIFTKGYGFGLIKLDLKTRSENGLEFKSSGSANTETSKVAGTLETKYKWAEHGLTFTEKWNTDNTLGTEITLEDQLAKGLKLTFDSSFSPNTGYVTCSVCLCSSILDATVLTNDGTEFGGSIYQKVNDNLETAVNLAWTTGNSNTRFGIAAKYQIDADASFSAKVNNSSLVGLGYTQTLKPGIKLTLSALLDGKNVNAGGHKLGLGLEFEA